MSAMVVEARSGCEGLNEEQTATLETALLHEAREVGHGQARWRARRLLPRARRHGVAADRLLEGEFDNLAASFLAQLKKGVEDAI
jgi:hypothetical protein